MAALDQALQQRAVVLAEEIMRDYFCRRDIYAVLDRMEPDATWVGPGEREKMYALADIRAHFELCQDAVPSCEMSDVDLHAVDLGPDICLVTGSMMIRTTPESQLLLEVNQRVSFIFRLVGGALRLVHLHNSNPYGEMHQEEYFPHKIGAQSYQYLQRLLREKNEVIDMIAGNIDGGLKGSNDDSMFSYFYVNEGLPRMLGFTYEEFMEKTGGTAVGAVYPPDLGAALDDCARCFARGPAYATEYRMERKDGSLIWVLDSGRKALDAEGITRINSIITDITPLKQAMFDLEVERERYRVALENITGAMCEYDIAGDLFTLYRKAEGGAACGMKRLVYPGFSVMVRDGQLVYPEDGEAFLALCTGCGSGPLEFRGRFLHPEGSWRWDQFSCSVICDAAGAPVRAIGMLKDVTEEKKKNLELLDQARRDGLTQLLNQTAVREAIQNHLAQRHGKRRKGALLMLDLDHFKEVNDSNGHLYGNDILAQTARTLEQAAGPDCIVGRSGGDEFLVLLCGANCAQATRVADEIVRRVGELGTEHAFAISCSVGIACLSGAEENFSQLFGRADRALYHAKNAGRNRWSMDPGEAGQ